jgi:hypothetical protein
LRSNRWPATHDRSTLSSPSEHRPVPSEVRLQTGTRFMHRENVKSRIWYALFYEPTSITQRIDSGHLTLRREGPLSAQFRRPQPRSARSAYVDSGPSPA